jgi:hypothetical protein
MFKLVLVVVLLLIASTIFAISRSGKLNSTGQRVAKVLSSIFFGIALLLVIYNSIGTVSTGHVAVKSFGGRVVLGEYFSEGAYIKPFWIDVEEMQVNRREVSKENATVFTSDEHEMTVTLSSIPYRLNPKYAAAVRRHFGGDEQFHEGIVSRSSAAALRDAYAGITETDALIGDREKVATSITTLFSAQVREQLRKFDAFMELDEEELEQVIIALPTQLGPVLPPERVRTAMAESKAAVIELQRQETLTSIAVEEAKRRKEEGSGIAKFLEGLPQDIDHSSAVQLLYASAEMERAKAFTQAVQDGKVSIAYVTEQGSNATIPTPAK